MTAKEYLSQAYRLDQKIKSSIQEAARLRDLAVSLQSPSLEPNYHAGRSTEAPFVRPLEKVLALEEHTKAEVETLVDLRTQIHRAIDAVEDPDERMVLRCRYLDDRSWSQTGKALNMAVSTVRRLHDTALSHVSVPEKGMNEQE